MECGQKWSSPVTRMAHKNLLCNSQHSIAFTVHWLNGKNSRHLEWGHKMQRARVFEWLYRAENSTSPTVHSTTGVRNKLPVLCLWDFGIVCYISYSTLTGTVSYREVLCKLHWEPPGLLGEGSLLGEGLCFNSELIGKGWKLSIRARGTCSWGVESCFFNIY